MNLANGLAAEYGFAGNADDTSGRGRHGVVHGATLIADRFGRPDHAYYFDGVDDYIEVSPPPAFTSHGLSVSSWVRYEPRDSVGGRTASSRRTTAMTKINRGECFSSAPTRGMSCGTG